MTVEVATGLCFVCDGRHLQTLCVNFPCWNFEVLGESGRRQMCDRRRVEEKQNTRVVMFS